MITNNLPIFPEDYEEIKKTEYEKAKRDNYKETSRVGFRFFKLKQKDKIIQGEFSDLNAEIMENGWVLLHQLGIDSCISLGIYPNARFDIIKRLLAELELKKLEEKIKEWH